jgi:hypothetical protein
MAPPSATMARRLSSIRFAHRVRNLPDPTIDARVMTVRQGTHGAPPDGSAHYSTCWPRPPALVR